MMSLKTGEMGRWRSSELFFGRAPPCFSRGGRMRARIGSTKAFPERKATKVSAALRPSRPFSEPTPPQPDLAGPGLDEQIERARLYGHRLPDALQNASPGVIQGFWPLNSLAKLLGIGG